MSKLAHPAELLTVRALARLAGVSERTVYYDLNGGRLQKVCSPNGRTRVLRSALAAHRSVPYRTVPFAVSIKTAWRLICRRAKIVGLRTHDLRRKGGSRWLEGGVPVQVVREWIGHTNISQTSTYLESTITGQHEAMRRFDQARALERAHQARTTEAPLVQPGAMEGGEPLVSDAAGPQTSRRSRSERRLQASGHSRSGTRAANRLESSRPDHFSESFHSINRGCSSIPRDALGRAWRKR